MMKVIFTLLFALMFLSCYEPMPEHYQNKFSAGAFKVIEASSECSGRFTKLQPIDGADLEYADTVFCMNLTGKARQVGMRFSCIYVELDSNDLRSCRGFKPFRQISVRSFQQIIK